MQENKKISELMTETHQEISTTIRILRTLAQFKNKNQTNKSICILEITNQTIEALQSQENPHANHQIFNA